MSRLSWVEVDLSALAHNVRELARLSSGSVMCAVVKADGYGHGAIRIARTALDNGATWLAVATVEEGVQLRDAEIRAPVLLLSEPPADDLETVVAKDLTPTVSRIPTMQALASTAQRQGVKDMQIHIKIDTGMHRMGVCVRSFPDLLSKLDTLPPLHLGGVWSHFAVADTDPAFTRHQIQTFMDAVGSSSGLGVSGQAPVLRHLANTPGMLFHPQSCLDMVRIGLGLYGLYPHPSSRKMAGLRPVMRIVSHISHVMHHPAGARPSYGRIRALPVSSAVATLPVGYADGVPRGISTGGEVLIGGRRLPLAGRVTMDQLIVDAGDHQVAVGDQAVLIGSQGAEAISLDEWASLADTINYEVVSRIGPRLPRRYLT